MKRLNLFKISTIFRLDSLLIFMAFIYLLHFNLFLILKFLEICKKMTKIVDSNAWWSSTSAARLVCSTMLVHNSILRIV